MVRIISTKDILYILPKEYYSEANLPNQPKKKPPKNPHKKNKKQPKKKD